MTPRLVFLDLHDGHIRRMDPPTQATVLCLGNFDGVHRAHASLFARAKAMAQDIRIHEHTSALCGVFSFFRPSVDFMEGESAPRHLTTLREKLHLFQSEGMDLVCLCDFREIRHLTPDEFLTLLTKQASCRGLVCGYNFRFGVGGSGDATFLSVHSCRPDSGYQAEIVPMMPRNGGPISSTRIRALLLAGDVEGANDLLGHPYALEATVVHGKHLGRALGFPTANQYFPAESLIPAHGVYATRCHTPWGVFPAVSNVGSHPTVDTDARVNCETYLVGFSHDLYGQRVRVEFLRHLRGEEKFPTVEALIEAIRRDAHTAQVYVSDHLTNPD